MDKESKQQELWDIQINILNVIDQVCKENDLHYSLYAGTLLGAVRHQGFIPWDDDLDVCMPRNDYEKFLMLWKDEDHPGYILQNKRNTPSFTQSFSKIRKDNTTFLQYEWEKGRYHTGIFVDIFPIDRCPASSLKQIHFCWQCMKYQLFTREFVPPKASFLVRAVSRAFLFLTSKFGRQKYRNYFEKKLINLFNNSEFPIVTIETTDELKKRYPNNLTDNYVEILFEGKKYPCFSQWDKFLRIQYGDYLKLPPEEERIWKHNHLTIDFNHNSGEES